MRLAVVSALAGCLPRRQGKIIVGSAAVVCVSHRRCGVVHRTCEPPRCFCSWTDRPTSAIVRVFLEKRTNAATSDLNLFRTVTRSWLRSAMQTTKQNHEKQRSLSRAFFLPRLGRCCRQHCLDRTVVGRVYFSSVFAFVLCCWRM